MGERVSIQFGRRSSDGDWLSAVLKYHWGGPEFPQQILEWVKSLTPENDKMPMSGPVDRLEPDAIMVTLTLAISPKSQNHSLRLVPTKDDCDNSDWGHFIIWLDSLEIEKIK